MRIVYQFVVIDWYTDLLAVRVLMEWTLDYYTLHYCDVTMSPTASQITSLTIVYWIVYAGTDQRKHQSSASPAFVRGIPRRPVNSPHKWPVTRKMFPFDDVIMKDIFCQANRLLTSFGVTVGIVGIVTCLCFEWYFGKFSALSALSYMDPAWLSLTNER